MTHPNCECHCHLFSHQSSTTKTSRNQDIKKWRRNHQKLRIESSRMNRRGVRQTRTWYMITNVKCTLMHQLLYYVYVCDLWYIYTFYYFYVLVYIHNYLYLVKSTSTLPNTKILKYTEYIQNSFKINIELFAKILSPFCKRL